MQYIEKSREPKSFTEQKAKGIQSFDDLEKTDLRTSLIKEQGYLCCYCMSRIEDDRRKVKIEHWYPESESIKEGDRGRTIKYSNLLLACCGKYGEYECCDTKKGQKIIFVNPQKKNHIKKIKYRKDGTIYSEDADLNDDLNNKLNLNIKRHKENRRIIYDLVREKLSEFQGTCSEANINKMINKWSTTGLEKRKEYYMVAIYFLQKKSNH